MIVDGERVCDTQEVIVRVVDDGVDYAVRTFESMYRGTETVPKYAVEAVLNALDRTFTTTLDVCPFEGEVEIRNGRWECPVCHEEHEEEDE